MAELTIVKGRLERLRYVKMQAQIGIEDHVRSIRLHTEGYTRKKIDEVPLGMIRDFADAACKLQDTLMEIEEETAALKRQLGM